MRALIHERGRRHSAALGLVAALALAGCQSTGTLPGGAQTVNGLEMAPPPAGATGTTPASTEGLTTYKVYNTTEALCERACQAEARCVTHGFSPLSTINGYVAGQCQFYGRS